ncbi:transforming acidic coiled-coil-containing 2 isoform X2 [Pelobates cultripes]|uniref:Transforming acidic coiled-coil-containing 2 isoform X2 n=2 Tax=Pelobates cultripes TaxID=61616 RepID=A0AAD1TGP9_PELCU|nr:transforming acidic coiled-coil-containing 2 isoform X2 [Pelobates cultripes]
MGNDNSRQAESQKEAPAVSSPVPVQVSSVDRKQEPEPDPGRESHQEIAENRLQEADSIFHESVGASATSLSGDNNLLSNVWEAGQLLPTLPLTDLYIDGVEYKESGPGLHPGTISVSTSEDYKDDTSGSDEIGLIGILREWGKDVLPEKITTKYEKEREESWVDATPQIPQDSLSDHSSPWDLQGQGIVSTFPTMLENTVNKVDNKVPSALNFNNKAAETPDSWGGKEQSNQSLNDPSQYISEPSELFSRNAVLSQLTVEPGSPDSTCIQAEEDSRDTVTALESEMIFYDTYDSEVVTASTAAHQTRCENSLILPHSTDGSSDMNKEKISVSSKPVPEACVRSGEPPAFLDIEPDIIASEYSSPGGLCNKSNINNQSTQKLLESKNLLPNQMNEKSAHQFFAEGPLQDTESFKHAKESDGANLKVDLKEKKPLIDHFQPGNTNHEIRGYPNVTATTGAVEYFNLKDESEREASAEIIRSMEEKKIISENANSKSVQVRQMDKENEDLCGINDLIQETSHLSRSRTDNRENLGITFSQTTPHEFSNCKEGQKCLEKVLLSGAPCTAKCGETVFDIVKKSSSEQGQAINKEVDVRIQAVVRNEDQEQMVMDTKVLSVPELSYYPAPGMETQAPTNLGEKELSVQDQKELNTFTGEVSSDTKKVTTGKKRKSTNKKKKAAKADTETTNLSVSESPHKMGYTTPSELQNIMIESTQPLNSVFETVSGGDERVIMKPATNTIFPFTEQRATSDIDSGNLASSKEQSVEAPEELVGETPAKIEDDTRQNQSGSDPWFTSADQTVCCDINGKLQAFVLSDVGSLNFMPDGTKELSKVQLILGTPPNCSGSIQECNISTNLVSMTTENEEEPLTKLSQQDGTSPENTPCALSDKLLQPEEVVEEKDIICEQKEPPVTSLSDCLITENRMDKDDPKSCGESGTQAVSNTVFDVAELPRLLSKTTGTVSVSCSDGIVSDDVETLGQEKGAKNNSDLNYSSEALDIPTQGISNTSLLASEGSIAGMSQDLSTERTEDKLPLIAVNSGTEKGLSASSLIVESEATACQRDTILDQTNQSKATLSICHDEGSLLVDTHGSGQTEYTRTDICEMIDGEVCINNQLSSASQSKEEVPYEGPSTEGLIETHKELFLGLPGCDTSSLNSTSSHDPMDGTVYNRFNIPGESLSVGEIPTNEVSARGINCESQSCDDHVSDGKSLASEIENLYIPKASESFVGKMKNQMSDLDAMVEPMPGERSQNTNGQLDKDVLMFESADAGNLLQIDVLVPGAKTRNLDQKDEINYNETNKPLVSEAVETAASPLMLLSSEGNIKSDVLDNIQNIQPADNNSSVSKYGADNNGSELMESVSDKQKCDLLEFAHQHIVTAGKLEEALDKQNHNAHQEIHPQEKHPDIVCKEICNISCDMREVTGQNVQELTSLKNDEIGKSTNWDILAEPTSFVDTISILKNASTTQSVSEESNTVSDSQVLSIHSNNFGPCNQVASSEKVRSQSKAEGHKDFPYEDGSGCKKTDVASPELNEDSIHIPKTMDVNSVKEHSDLPGKHKENTDISANNLQLNNKETTFKKPSVLSEKIQIEKILKTPEEPGLIVPIERATTPEIVCAIPRELVLKYDGSYLASKETDILSDVSDDFSFTPKEIESLSKNASPLPDELAPEEQPSAIDEEPNIVLQNAKMINDKCGPSLVETGISERENKSKEPGSTCESPATTLKEQDLPTEDTMHSSVHLDIPPLKSDSDTEKPSRAHEPSSSSNEKFNSPDTEPAPLSPAIRSPTFPTSDSYNFTQKLRSVLHSERPFPKKPGTPTSPDLLVLPSSPRLLTEGALPERSSDSEEAFETPESTTPVKSAPPVSIPPLPEVLEQQPLQREEEDIPSPPLPPENPDLLSCLEDILAAETSEVEKSEEPAFRPPSRSFSVVFDEDKPIASSGAYNLDSLANSEPTNDISNFSEAPARARRKSTDSVPVARNTLSRSLSLQASDFQIDDAICSQGGSDSACSTLRRTKKPRPTSLKKKPIKKEPEAVGTKEAKQELTGESQETEVEKTSHVVPGDDPPLPQAESDLPSTGEQTLIFPSSQTSSVDVQEVSAGTVPFSDSCPSQETGKSSPVLVCHQEPEVTTGDIEVPVTTGVIGQSVRLEFDYSEEAREGQPPIRKGKKPSGKMPLRKPKPKKPVEKTDPPPGSPSHITVDPVDIPIGKGSYTYNMDKWDDPNFNPFSSSGKMLDSLSATQESPEQFKTVSRSESPAKLPASFEIPTNVTEQNNVEINKPAKKKKTPLKTDTFRVKKSPKRSPVTENGSEELTILSNPETPPVITSEEHATDEEKLASSVSSQKWTCMAVDLAPEKQDYPQPSDLTSFVNENQFHTSSDDIEYGNSYNIEYMEKTGTCSPLRDVPQTQSVYLMFEATQDSPVKTPAKFSETCTPGTDSSYDGMESTMCSGKLPCPRTPPILQDSMRQPLDRTRQREEESSSLGSGKMELGSPDDAYVTAETLLSRISHQAALCDELSYLEPDLAEKNPQAFAQKLQEELEFAAMRIEALKLARHISLSSQCSLHTEGLEPADGALSHSSLYSRAVAMETTSGGLLLPFQQSDIDTALQLAREEIAVKEREVTEWKQKYEESRCEVVEMRKIVAEYEKTIAQMIEDEQREKSVSHHTVQQLIIEKEQALSDLNSVEKSLADLFRRYEKMKDVLEGFRKNEEVLKKCAQEYLSRVKKEEQRYHALKIHAEEKLDRANADIAQVRIKSQQEHAAYQASLRKEQLKVDALERTLEQKNKEIEELTKICDELIMKMGKS